MADNDVSILPSTKIAALLDRYPQLEDILIALAPPFKKLRNPLLRRSVARVASVQHAAAVGRIPVSALVNKLRAAVGQPPMTAADSDETNYFSVQPEWFDSSRIVASIDERTADPDKMPVVAVLQQAVALQPGEILELLTTYLPAPGIEIMQRKGFRVWSSQLSPGQIRTYFSKQANTSG